jgi:predicted transcriptional regulator
MTLCLSLISGETQNESYCNHIDCDLIILIMETQTVTAHIPKTLVARVDELASKLDRPRGWVVKEALADWVALEEERHQLTLTALADVDAGRLVDHEAMLDWASRLNADNPGAAPIE